MFYSSSAQLSQQRCAVQKKRIPEYLLRSLIKPRLALSVWGLPLSFGMERWNMLFFFHYLTCLQWKRPNLHHATRLKMGTPGGVESTDFSDPWDILLGPSNIGGKVRWQMAIRTKFCQKKCTCRILSGQILKILPKARWVFRAKTAGYSDAGWISEVFMTSNI